MKENSLVWIGAAVVLFLLWKNGVFSALMGGASSTSTTGAVTPSSATPQQVAAAVNLYSALPGTNPVANQYLSNPAQQVNPNDPSPIACQPGTWPTRVSTLISPNGWACETPQVWD